MRIALGPTCCVALAIALVACRDSVSPPGGAGARAIVFVARTEVPGGGVGPPGLYSIRPDGRRLRRLTLGAGHALEPAWSRDGSRIAFASSTEGGAEIWLVNPDGSDAHRASSTFPACGYDYTHLTWEASGRRLAAECWSQTSIFDLEVGGAYSLSERLGWNIYAPDWSPTESQILFTGLVESSYDALVVNPDAGAPMRLFGPAADPAWSPDGSSIAFTRPVDDRSAIHIASRDGSSERAITVPDESGWGDEGPAWSPDGKWITFHRTSVLCANVGTPRREVCIPHWSIHIVRTDGTGLRKLTPDSLQATRPTW